MYLNELVGKPVFTDKRNYGVLRGVGVSKKKKTVEYLFISTVSNDSVFTEVAVPVKQIESISDGGIQLTKIRTAYPKGVLRFFIGRPIYSPTGKYVGITKDLVLDGFFVESLLTDSGQKIPFSLLSAFGDAVLLKKKSVYPLGERLREKDGFVTKSVLKNAIQKGVLIKLTTSLSPFKR